MDVLEVYRRARTGPVMSEDAFDLDRVFGTARSLCEKHGIVYDPDTPVPSDDDLADRVFQAGVDFVAEVGAFCRDTGKVIHFTRDEILEAVAGAPGRCVMGEGADRREWLPRRPDSGGKPWLHVGAGIAVSDERILQALAKGYAAIDRADSISISALETLNGERVESGAPSEIVAAIRQIQLARQALTEAGRPGVAIGNCISTAGTHLAAIAASGSQFGLRPSDAWLVGMTAEMKVDADTLNKLAFLSEWGANVVFEAAPMLGGYLGGPAAVAVGNMTYVLLGRIVMNCSCHLLFPFHINQHCTTTRDVLWSVAVSVQAATRNTKELIWANPYAAAGPMTKQYYYESAAYIAAAITSGGSMETCHPARAVVTDGVTPMEKLGCVELAEACVGMSRADANELVKKLLAMYEDDIDDAPAGCTYTDCYDLETGQPGQEYVDLYGEVKDELRAMGFPYRS